jgi:hypothetical protein
MTASARTALANRLKFRVLRRALPKPRGPLRGALPSGAGPERIGRTAPIAAGISGRIKPNAMSPARWPKSPPDHGAQQIP